MPKRLLLLSIITAFLLLTSSTVFAEEKEPQALCTKGIDTCKDQGGKKYSCQFNIRDTYTNTVIYTCQETSTIGQIFGTIEPPIPLVGLLRKDPTGAGGISMFISNGIVLIYSIAAIVLLFMILWGAFQWMTSGGDKEQLAGAQRRIINAMIGIILFAAAFAIISVIGAFTGFKFFTGQNVQILRFDNGYIRGVQCPGQKDPIIYSFKNEQEAYARCDK